MKVVISGYYGFDNAGDEAVLAAMLADLRRLHPGVQPVVLSGHPERTVQRHRVEAVPRLSMAAVRRALMDAELFISGGGTLLQDATGWGSVPYYGGLMLWARRLGVPVFVYAQGLGPLRRPALRRLARRALTAAAGVTLRDDASAALARELGVTPSLVEVTADPVFGLAEMPDSTASDQAVRLLAALPPGPVIGVSLRPFPGQDPAGAASADQVAAVLRPLLAQWGARVLPLPLHPSQDGPLIERLVAALGTAAVRWPVEVRPASLMPGDWLAVYRRLDLCLTMRLHGLIFAACAGVPFVAVGDDPKLAGHVDEMGLPRDLFLVHRLDGLANTLAAAWRQRAQGRVAVAAGAARLAQRARTTAHRALAVAKGAAR